MSASSRPESDLPGQGDATESARRPEHDDRFEELRQTGYAFVDLVLDYFKGIEGRRVYGPMSPMGMDDLFSEELPEEGCSYQDLVQETRAKIFPNTMAIGSRRYFGMMNPAPLPIAVLADALCSAMNQNAASWRHAPAGTAVEKRVIRWLCDLFGLPETSFGTLIDGGSLANITGLKLAINRALGRHLSQLDDLSPPGPEIAKLTFYVSDQGHYSFIKAVDLLGLGRGQLRRIPTDDIYRIDLAALERSIEDDLAAGLKPCCVIGIAGTTNTGSIDKLAELARIARKHACWYHVDAAYGGAVILSDRYKPMLQGIEEADSITVDPHKWFYMPFSAGGILVREGDFLRQSFLVHPEYYMEKVKAGDDGEAEEFDEFGRRIVPDPRGFHMGDKVNFFQYGVAGSRRFNALKVWMSLKLAGRKQIGEWVDNDIYLARLLAALLRRESDFALLGPNTLGVCNFRWEPRNPDGSVRFDDETTDGLNRQLQEQVEREGDAWFSYTDLRGRTALRVNVENRRMRRENIERLVRVIRRTADRILAGPGPNQP